MHKLLSMIQQTSQARLKGTPRIIGSMRSQRATEKHMATKGIKARRRARSDGFFTGTGSLSIAPLLKGFGVALQTSVRGESVNFRVVGNPEATLGGTPKSRFDGLQKNGAASARYSPLSEGFHRTCVGILSGYAVIQTQSV
jgi:hypothetical protein